MIGDSARAMPRTRATRSGEANTAAGPVYPCPACHAPLMQRSSARGPFWGCSRYPDCTATLPDRGGKPGRRAPVFSRDQKVAPAAPGRAGDPCPLCGQGSVVRRFGKKTGKSFLGCTHFPRCRFAQ